MMIDSHCHLNDEAFSQDVDEVISRAKENGVKAILVLGWDIESSRHALEIAKRHEGVYCAVGVHPQNMADIPFPAIEEIRSMAKDDKVIAIGEIGLDFYWEKDPAIHEKQKEWFIRQIELANELSLPCSIHAREAIQATYDLLKDNPIKEGAVLHCYGGSVEMMKEFDKLGLYFGFDGPITYKNSITPKECVMACKEERILTETDCPYLSPVPYRGKRNEPAHIKEILEQMALLRGVKTELMETQVENNFRRLFKI